MESNILLSDDKRKEYAEYIKIVPPYPDPDETGFFVLDGSLDRQWATSCRDMLKRDCIARNVPFDYDVAPAPPEDIILFEK